MCCLLVSGFLTEMTQQIHSLRASGVISSHFASAAGSEMRTLRRSAGKLCTAPPEIVGLAMDFILHRYATSPGVPGRCSDWAAEKSQLGAWGKDSYAPPGLAKGMAHAAFAHRSHACCCWQDERGYKEKAQSPLPMRLCAYPPIGDDRFP